MATKKKSYLIDHRLPKGWKDLQNKVAEILTEIGFKTEIEKDINTVRGIVNIDVFSVDESQSPSIIYLCECKHWEKLVPKTIVHSFRTVVSDYGANFGIIISKKGFQKGAFKAAKYTNIELVDWFDFQDMFIEKWFPAISHNIYNKYEALTDYTEPLISSSLIKKLDQFDKEKVEKFHKLRRKYLIIGAALLNLGFGRILQTKQKLEFPRVLYIPTEKQNKFKQETFYSLRDYTNCLISYCKIGLKEFDELFRSDV